MLDAPLQTLSDLVNTGNTYLFLLPVYTVLLLGPRGAGTPTSLEQP